MEKEFFSFKNFILLIYLMLGITACGSDNSKVTSSEKTASGFLYTTTNGESDNTIIRLTRYSDGSLGGEKVFHTNGQGGANIDAGGDARGDFDTQGGIQIINDYLLTVNAGDNTISIFSLNRNNGDLTFTSSVDSNGIRPVTIAYTPKRNLEGQYWVIVGNQWNNPNVQKSDNEIERYPNNDFFSQDLSSPDRSDAERNITLFSFDSTNGVLTQEGTTSVDSFVRKNGGPTTVTFSDDGSKVAVSTWGIAHFATDSPSLDEQRASRVYVYDFNNLNGIISNKRYFEEEGIAGTIGINWARGSNAIIHASNFNIINAKNDHGLTVLSDSGAEVTKVQNFLTGQTGTIDEACWTILSPKGDRVYIASFSGNAISPFELSSSGQVLTELPIEKRGDITPVGDTKEMYISSNNKYLYVVGAFNSYTLNVFEITEQGLSYKSQYIYETTKPFSGQSGVYNFLGLTGFDLQ